MLQVEVGGFKRINKARARKMYDANQTFYVCPSKLIPTEDCWNTAIEVRLIVGRSFENIMNEASYYNCGPCAGKYLNYYIKENKGE